MRKAGLPDVALEAAAMAESELAPRSGQTGNRSKLEPAKIRELEKLPGEGLSHGAIAEMTGISEGSVFQRAKKWQTVNVLTVAGNSK